MMNSSSSANELSVALRRWRRGMLLNAFLITIVLLDTFNHGESAFITSSFHRPSFVSGKISRCEQCPIFAYNNNIADDVSGKDTKYLNNNNNNNNDDDDEGDFDPVILPQGMEDLLSESELDSLTVPQLKQQLRLRGLKVGGRKRELIDRLLLATSSAPNSLSFQDSPNNEEPTTDEHKSKARKFAENRGKEFIDITEYLDEDDQGKDFKTWNKDNVVDAEFDKNENDEMDGSSNNNAEVWGSEARVVDDYEGRRLVIDCLTRNVVEFKGSNQSYVSAFVVASRDALKPFLSGGGGNQNRTAAEDLLREIQSVREKASKRPVRFQDDEGIDEGDETGLYANAIERDHSDWGKYTLTGAQLSAQEVQGVLLLSDVYGAFTEDTKALAEKIAFECQPVVVMVPDLFRGEPWKEDNAIPGKNTKGQTYEQWRATHGDLRVSIDIRAAAACLRERYGVSSVVVWGTCYGGGRALEAVSGYLPEGKIHDYDGSVGPPLVNPMACVAWYPTRYNVTTLFGKNHKGNEQGMDGAKRDFAVMGVFAGNDKLDGATSEDALKLKELLCEDKRVKDYLVKVFPGQDHGFAHRGLGSLTEDDENSYFGRFVDDEFGGAGRVSMDDGDADVACLLSTAFMETYSRVFLPTTGAGTIKEEGNEWSSNLEMPNVFKINDRDIRAEIEDAADNFAGEPLGGLRIDPTDPESREEMEKLLRRMQNEDEAGPLKIEGGDDLETMYAKLKAQDENFQLF